MNHPFVDTGWRAPSGEHPMEQKFQQDKANREDAEKWRAHEQTRDCRMCQHVRTLNLFKDEFFCGSPIRCENANRFVMIGSHPIALWEKRERATF